MLGNLKIRTILVLIQFNINNFYSLSIGPYNSSKYKGCEENRGFYLKSISNGSSKNEIFMLTHLSFIIFMILYLSIQ